MRKVYKDYITSVGMFLFSFIYLIYTFRIPKAPIGNAYTPRIFPLILATMGIVLSLVLLGRSIILKRKQDANAHDEAHQYKDDNPTSYESRKDTIHLLRLTVVASVLGIGYALCFELLGYPLSTTLFLTGYMFFINGIKRWKVNVLLPILFSITVYIVFSRLLSVPLPLYPGL